MFKYNGTDYTVIVIAVASFLLLFALQYFLCVKAKKRAVKLLPFLYVVLILAFAACMLLFDGGDGGWIDLSGFFALVFLIYAAICAAAIGLAWGIYALALRGSRLRSAGPET